MGRWVLCVLLLFSLSLSWNDLGGSTASDEGKLPLDEIGSLQDGRLTVLSLSNSGGRLRQHASPPPDPPSPPPPASPPPPPPPSPSPPPPQSPPPPSPPPPSPPPPPASDAVLSGITLSTGTLTPAFNESVFTYTASVASSVSELQVTVYLPEDEIYAGYNVNLNGTSVESGVAGPELTLGARGETVSIVIYVSAEGYVSSTYMVSVTRGSRSGLAPGIYIALIVIAAVIVLGVIAFVIFCARRRGWFSRAKSNDYQSIPSA